MPYNYPTTEKSNHVQTLHGHSISDPYHWLENYSSPEVKSWVTAQNTCTQQQLAEHVDRQTLKSQLQKYIAIHVVNISIPRGEYYFWQERSAHQNQPVLYFRHHIAGKPQVLIDPNLLDPSGNTHLDYWRVSPNGTYLAYGLSKGGDENAIMYLLNVHTGQQLPEHILGARYSDVAWLPDESGFYYTRHPFPGTVPKEDELYYEKVYFHQLNTSINSDTLIYGANIPKEHMVNIHISIDGQWLAIAQQPDWTSTEIHLYHCPTKTLTPVITDITAKFSPQIHRNKLYLVTNHNAPLFKVIATDLSQKLPTVLSDWQEIITETDKTLEYAVAVSDYLVVSHLHNVVSELALYQLTGKFHKQIDLPPNATLFGISTQRERSDFFYSFETFTTPHSVYHYDLTSATSTLYAQGDNPVADSKFQSQQIWYTSKDGTTIPMFVISRSDIKSDEPAPTVLWGYGGFGSSMQPMFLRRWIPFLEAGGIVALANIRGGGEFGEQWHQQGILDHKQTSFDDFIAAAEYLVKKKYTQSSQLALYGGSNGGLLVTACAIQRPDLFQAVISKVPLTDMVRFPHFLMAARWVHEYGNPDDPQDLPKILKWSPYHNVKSGTQYPAFLFTTGSNDSRVAPFHAYKMTAILQSLNQPNPVLLSVDTAAGHGAGKALQQTINEATDDLSFLSWQLGLKI